MNLLTILLFAWLRMPIPFGTPNIENHPDTPNIGDTTVVVDITICFGEVYSGYAESGMYIDTFKAGGMDSIRVLNLTVLPAITTEIRTGVCPGDSIAGHYAPTPNSYIFRDTFVAQNGCDSIRTLRVAAVQVCAPYLLFPLDSCQSSMSNGTHMDYSEFTYSILDSVECGIPGLLCMHIDTAYVFRSSGESNKHSCTPGINTSRAMCINSSPECMYQAGAPEALNVHAAVGAVYAIQYMTGIEFYARAPIWYSWINGPTGLNNYPLLFGIRILVNGQEVYRLTDIPTTRQWKHYYIPLTRLGAAVLMPASRQITIEFLPYCPLGIDVDVSAWDIDEIILHHGYYTLEGPPGIVHGVVRTNKGSGISGAYLMLSKTPEFSDPITVVTDPFGKYSFEEPLSPGTYYLKVEKQEEEMLDISALDLVPIRKHILGITPFTMAFELMQADIDGNNQINALDIVTLQRYLLGMDSAYYGISPWRIGMFSGESPHTYPASWQEVIKIEYDGIDPVEVNWLAVKIGNCHH